MDHELQAGRNFAWASVAQVALRVLGLIFFVFMSHRLKETGLGQYGFISSFVVFWFIISDFGAGGYLFREWAKGAGDPHLVQKDFNIVLSMRLVVGSLILVPFLIINFFINKEIYVALVLFFFSAFLAVLINLADTYLQATNQFKVSATRQILEKCIVVVVGFVLLWFFPRLEMVFVATLLAQVASSMYTASVFPFKFHYIIDWSRAKNLAVRGLPFLFIAIVTSLYNRIDIVMLRFMDTFEAVGWYSTAYKFLELAAVFPAVLFLPAIFPVLSRLYNDTTKRQEYNDFLQKAIRILFSTGLITTILFIAYSPFAVSFFFPASFGPSVLAIRILIIAQIISSLTVLFSNLLIIQHQEKKGLYIIVAGAVLNILLNIFLIPRMSLYGAAWATVLAELVNLCLLQYFAAWGKESSVIFKMALFVVGNGILLAFLKYAGLMNQVVLGTGLLLLNVALLVVTGLLQKGDVDLFLNPIKLKIKTFSHSNV